MIKKLRKSFGEGVEIETVPIDTSEFFDSLPH